MWGRDVGEHPETPSHDRRGRGAPVRARPSVPLARVDVAEVRRRFREDGFAVLPGLLPADEVLDVRGQVAGVLDQHGWLAPGSLPDDLVPDARRRDGSPGWWHVYEDVQRLEPLHRLAHHRALTSVVRALVGNPLLNHPRRYLTLVPPEFRIPPHQEFLHVQGTPDVVSAWIPVTAFGADTCTLRVLRGARTLRPLTPLPGTGGAEAAAPPPEDPDWWVSEALAPGDVVLVHGLTLWGCDENVSPALRGALLARYQSARLPVCRASVEPHHYPRLPGWPVLTEGWSSRRWVRVPWPRRTVPFVLGQLETWHDQVRVPAARLADVRTD